MNCSHCDKPIDDHEASHQTDACVATVVFGATGWEKPHIQTVLMRIFPLPYSSDMANAWQVVEKLHTRNSYCTINSGGWEEIVWEVELRVYSIDEEQEPAKFKALADTAPLAICRAALKACLTN